MGVYRRQPFYLQKGFSNHVVLFRITVGKLTSYHQTDNFIHRQLFRGTGRNPLSVSHNRYFIGNTQDFFHLMRNIDNSASPAPKHVDNSEQVLHFLLCEGRSRLVKNNHLRLVGNRFCNLHHLSLRYRHPAHNRLRVHMNIQLVKDFLRRRIHLCLAGERAPPGYLRETSQPHIVHYVSLERLVELLVHHGNSVFQSLLGGLEVYLPAFQINMTAVFVVDAEKAFHQSGFTGAVLPH